MTTFLDLLKKENVIREKLIFCGSESAVVSCLEVLLDRNCFIGEGSIDCKQKNLCDLTFDVTYLS